MQCIVIVKSQHTILMCIQNTQMHIRARIMSVSKHILCAFSMNSNRKKRCNKPIKNREIEHWKLIFPRTETQCKWIHLYNNVQHDILERISEVTWNLVVKPKNLHLHADQRNFFDMLWFFHYDELNRTKPSHTWTDCELNTIASALNYAHECWKSDEAGCLYTDVPTSTMI